MGVNMKTRGKHLILGMLATIAVCTTLVYSHCQLPCGIYDDPARFGEMRENITTIEKSMNLIQALSAEDKPNMNQIVRWVMNKEDHADKLQETVTQYFMTQRIKLDAKDYDKKLGLLHQMLVYGMKCKQTTDLSNVEKLRQLVKDFQAIYF